MTPPAMGEVDVRPEHALDGLQVRQKPVRRELDAAGDPVRKMCQ